jgi:hypothetical protein
LPAIVSPGTRNVSSYRAELTRETFEGCAACQGQHQSLLTGKIFDDRGNRMTPSSAKKDAVRYRYYVSAVLTQGRKREAGSIAHVSARRLKPSSSKPWVRRFGHRQKHAAKSSTTWMPH